MSQMSQNACQKPFGTKKKPLNVFKCLKNKEIKIKNYLCYTCEILAQVHPPGCTYNRLFK